MTPTARTLKHYRDQGFAVAVCERWNAYARIRQDLFGFIDAIAIHPIEGTIALQCCAAASHANRRTKLLAEPNVDTWLRAGNRVQVVSWRKAGERGKVKRWTVRVEELSLQDVTARDA